jgi:hypothetical protein
LARQAVGTLLLLPILGCGDSPTVTPVELPARPLLLAPVGGSQASADRPTFLVRNARGFDAGQASYTFRVTTPGGREVLLATTPATATNTSLTPVDPLPRGRLLEWAVTAEGPSGQVASDSASFRTVPVPCLAASDPYAKSVVEFSIPECSLAQNLYNDPLEVLGPPDAGGRAPNMFHGFLSLGYKGHVTVDMEGCAVDGEGPDVRVFQSVSMEPVTLYGAGSPEGPFEVLAARKVCGSRLSGVFSKYCDFDLAAAELSEARYFRIEDGEHTPCEDATTVTEGADIDAIEILHLRP